MSETPLEGTIQPLQVARVWPKTPHKVCVGLFANDAEPRLNKKPMMRNTEKHQTVHASDVRRIVVYHVAKSLFDNQATETMCNEHHGPCMESFVIFSVSCERERGLYALQRSSQAVANVLDILERIAVGKR